MGCGWMKSILVLAMLGSAVAACAPSQKVQSPGIDGGYTIYLVRHAEKMADADDPALTQDGEVRAEQLADLLEDAGIETIWSTDYRRTMATATPLASRLGLDIAVYDAGNLPAFASKVEAAGETALVVGHSNTTPPLSALLGGEPGEDINEAAEYDRLYVLTGVGTGDTRTEIQRFGAVYDAPSD